MIRKSLLFLLGLGLFSSIGHGQRVVVHPSDNGAALVNPGMGWIFYQYDDDLREFGSGLDSSDTLKEFPGLSVVYMRVTWSDIEPSDDHFDWSLIDTPAQRWISAGKRVAFRFTSTESAWPGPRFATPAWVRDAGAKGNFFKAGEGATADGEFWEPDYDDPIYLAKLTSFLKAVAARYDGNPNIAFMDVGSFGVWGEGHTIWSSKIPYTAATVERIIDIYKQCFKKTLLVANDDFASQGRGDSPLAHARSLGLGLRDDSILVHAGKEGYTSADKAQAFWPSVPVILESQYFGTAKQSGTWGDGQKLVDAVEAYHASYIGFQWWPREFLRENKDLVDRINRRMGYRFRILEADWPASSPNDALLVFHVALANAGVAPCYQGGHLAITLETAQGGIAAVLVDDDYNLGNLRTEDTDAVERSLAASFRLPDPLETRTTLRPGIYGVYVSVGDQIGTPVYAMPLDNDDGMKRYKLGSIKITEGRAQVLAPPE